MGDDVKQGELFEARRRYPEIAGYTEPTTSRDAADVVNRTIGQRQNVVLAAFEQVGSAGLTPDEAADRIGISVLAVRPRVTELHKLGLLVPTGDRRANVSGLKAKAWKRSEKPR